jgi:hypothetical protein
MVTTVRNASPQFVKSLPNRLRGDSSICNKFALARQQHRASVRPQVETIEREDRFLLDGLPKRPDFGTLIKREHIVQLYLAPTEKNSPRASDAKKIRTLANSPTNTCKKAHGAST